MPLGLKWKFFNQQNFSFKEQVLEQRYLRWRDKPRLKQVSCILALTASLYIVMAMIECWIAPSELSPFAWKIHGLILAPSLFFISYLATKNTLVKYTDTLLFLSPIFAALMNVYLRDALEWNNTYVSELHLMIFWIFTVSGMRLSSATISAGFVFMISVFSSLDFPFYGLVMHLFWSTAALSFGFLGAYLLESSYRKAFRDEIHLEELAQRDALTGLYNRARFDLLIEDELARMSRVKHHFACIFIDIDYFKDVNDMYGHKVGDEVLVEVSELILGSTRQNDSAIRWGGEEFILLCVEIDEEGALAVCEHLRKSINQYTFTQVGELSISVGYTLSREDDTVHSIVQRADKALYEAKDKGRNCVVYL